MASRLISYSFILILCCTLTPAYAEKNTLIISSESWENATHRDGSGLYWDIFRAVYEPVGYVVEPEIRSYQGSINNLKLKRSDVMVGAYLDEIDDVIYPKNYFAVDIVQVIYPKNRRFKWEGLNSIKDSNVSWIDGYSFDDYLPESISKNLHIRKVNNRETVFRLLNANKVDFFMDARSDLINFFKSNIEYKSDNYVTNIVLELKLFTVFSNDKKGKMLAEIFDQRFAILLANGEIKRLYDKYENSNLMYPSDY